MSSQAADDAIPSSELIKSPRDPCGEVLSCEEILRKILRCVNREGEHRERDPSNVALVNRLFLCLSLDLQWETAYSFDPLISLLNRLETIHDYPDKALLVFEEYTRRIRVLVLENKDKQSDGFPILSAARLVARLQPGGPVLPLLRSISVVLPHGTDLLVAYHEMKAHPLAAAMSPNEPHTETTILARVLKSLFSLINPDSLQNLVLHLPEPGCLFDEGSIEYIRPFTALHHFSITSAGYDLPVFELMEWVAELKHLQTLNIDVRASEDPPESASTLRSKASSIHLLHLSGPFPFIRAAVHTFRDVSKRIEFEVYDVGSGEGDDIESFIYSLNHPDLVVIFSEPE